MKKIVCIVLLAVLSFSAKAQVPNNGFETLNSFNNTSNWGEVHLLVISVDSNGVFHGDSIVYDDPAERLYFPTTDAYLGMYALEMRNAFNYTTNSPMVGRAALSQFEEDYSGFGGSLVPVTVRPTDLSFYYKYFPVNTDTAFVSLSVYDSNGVEIGTAFIEITDPTNVYTLATRSIHYTSTNPTAYISMEFRTAKPGTQASLGTRFQVDEVNVSIVGLKQEEDVTEALTCYPVPVTDVLKIKRTGEWANVLTQSSVSVTIFNALGAVVLNEPGYIYSAGIDVSTLEPGIYIIEIKDIKGKRSIRFIK